MNRGWISIHRKMQDHWLWSEKRCFSKAEAWIDMLFMANHKDNKFVVGNELITVKTGSFITSELKLMDRWKWSKSKVRAFLILLERDKMIVKISDNKKTTLSIVNYGDYQDIQTAKKLQSDFNPTSKEHQKDTNNNVNNVNNENKRERGAKNSRAIDFLKNNYPARFEEDFLMKYKSKIQNPKKFAADFNDTVDQEGLEYTDKKLFGRLGKYARNWIDNQERYNKTPSPSSYESGKQKRI